MANSDTRFESYSVYRPSGMACLGDIPKGWVVKRLKFVANSNVKSLPEDTPENYSFRYLDIGIVGTGCLLDDPTELVFGNAPSRARRIVTRGETIISTVRTYLKAIYYFEFDPSDLVVSTGFAVIQPKHDILPKYFYYLSLSQNFIDSIVSNSCGVSYPAINESLLMKLPIWYPSHPAQSTIVEYLDRETTSIDAVIAKKQKLIELLKEKRQALITQAVTKGLDASAKLKPSGIEWLGDIPEGWDVKRLRFLSIGPFDYGANEEASEDNPDNPRYIRITDIQEDGELHADTFRSLPVEIAAPYLLRNGDILFARSGATVGKTFRFKESWGTCCYAGYLIRMRPDERRIESEFLYYITLSHAYSQWRDSIFWQATIQNISADKYKNFTIAVPPLEEQRNIVRYLDTATQKIDQVLTMISIQIERLREYRQVLITNAVTGKIDVSATEAHIE